MMMSKQLLLPSSPTKHSRRRYKLVRVMSCLPLKKIMSVGRSEPSFGAACHESFTTVVGGCGGGADRSAIRSQHVLARAMAIGTTALPLNCPQ